MIDTPSITRQHLTPIHQNISLSSDSVSAAAAAAQDQSLIFRATAIPAVANGSDTGDCAVPGSTSSSGNNALDGSTQDGFMQWRKLSDAELIRIPIDLTRPSPPTYISSQMPGQVSGSAEAKYLDGVMWRGNLYLQIPGGPNLGGISKEAFINLLDFAEEQLKAANVIVFFSKCRRERSKWPPFTPTTHS